MKEINLNGAIVSTNDVSIYEIYTIIIDEKEKSIECLDFANNTLARIQYEFSNGPIEIDNYDKNGYINEFSDTLIDSNGKIVTKYLR